MKIKFGNRERFEFLVIIGIICLLFIFSTTGVFSQLTERQENNIFGQIAETQLGLTGEIRIEGVGSFKFDPHEIVSLRQDIFKKGHFSVFDILVYLDKIQKIELSYHFDKPINSHIIDAINGKENYWYVVYYDGGWPECNAYRMDHYPYKDKMFIRIYRESENFLEQRYEIFRAEIERLEKNNGKVIIPEVIIDGPTTRLTLKDIKVTPHNLRNDIFKEGYITAIDVIMSLGDQNKISYDLQWYDSIGTAGVVKNYWVERINKDQAMGRCGFVYESGSDDFRGFRGNHIHLPSDVRGINSPEYVLFFWICL